jgi:hypothetical protein
MPIKNGTILILIVMLGFVRESFCQTPAERAEAFNSVIGKDYRVSVKGNTLLIEGYREGKQLKLDKVNVFDLDLGSMMYSGVDTTVSVKCLDGLDGCVERHLLLDKKKSYRERMVFAVPSEGDANEIMSKLNELLKSMYNRK